MRLAVYGTVSTLAASGVVLSAFAQRANFYSATVYLAQSNACLMILTNFSLLCAFLLAHVLQRILYGPLRDLEVESLYEKAWYAVTETCLAMTIFRGEWNVRFVVCFAGLLFAKGFCWLSAGRVEMMEQTPPANPRLFHTRLVASLVLLIASDVAMVYYAVSDILEAAKPGMMVMFAFEFAILLIAALSTAGRYGLSITEKVIVQKQATARRLAREAERAAAVAQGTEAELLQNDDEGEDDFDLVWEEKGTWMFYLELGTDFLKLLTYLAFFFIVLTFYGLPLHIIRDVYMTLRSFISRIRDFIRYRRATNDMNARYPDATAEEVERENVCIICREEMRPYIPRDGAQDPHGAAQTQQRQRMRPKKLPCGHILHFACLRSWLERQQRCPTCRRPVLEAAAPPANHIGGQQPGAAQQPGGRRGGIAWGGQFGGIRVNFGVNQGPDFMQNLVNQWENRQLQAQNQAAGGFVAQNAQQNQNERQQDTNAQQNVTTPQNTSNVENLQPQPTQSGLTNLRNLHIQLLDLERRLRRELEAVEAVSATVSDTRNLRSRLVQLRSGSSTGVASDILSNNNTNASNSPSTFQFEQATHTQDQLPVGLQDLHIPAGWQVLPLTPIGVNTPGAVNDGPASVSGIDLGGLVNGSPLPQATLADLRRRRFGRGDVRNYNSTLRDYHAVRSPGIERTEAEAGFTDGSVPTPTSSAAAVSTPSQLPHGNTTTPQSAAAREADLSSTHSLDTSEVGNMSEEYVASAERELGAEFNNRSAVVELVERILGDAQHALSERGRPAEATPRPNSTLPPNPPEVNTLASTESEAEHRINFGGNPVIPENGSYGGVQSNESTTSVAADTVDTELAQSAKPASDDVVLQDADLNSTPTAENVESNSHEKGKARAPTIESDDE
ncbi:RING finger protein [Peziza echinospora]|nr:RING finger protein [Peziza echinospora]